MDFEFNITPDDYVAAGLLNGKMQKNAERLHHIIDIILIILGVTAWYFDKVIIAGGLIGAVVGGNLLPFILRRLYAPWYLRRHYNKYKKMNKPFSISLDNYGVNFKSETDSGIVKWEDIYKWRKNDSLILIYLAPRIYHLIPTRIANKGFPIEKLEDSLINHVGPAT